MFSIKNMLQPTKCEKIWFKVKLKNAHLPSHIYIHTYIYKQFLHADIHVPYFLDYKLQRILIALSKTGIFSMKNVNKSRIKRS